MSEFIYAYKKMPDDLEINGATLIDWQDLPEISRILNDKFSFYGNYQKDGQNKEYLKKGNFIKALTENGTWQYFEIFKVKKNMKSIAVTARFIGAMANKNFIDYSFTNSGNGSQIMASLQNSLAFPQKFRYSSDVTTVHQFTAKQVKPIDAIIGSNNGNQNLVGVTGAELDVDNYELKLVSQIGNDNGYRIDFGINLEAIEAEVDEESVVNSLYLIGGVPETDYDEDKEPIIFKYLEVAGVTDENRKIGKRENSNCKTVEELKTWGQTLFDNDRIHEPTATHKVNMVALEHTVEYGEIYQKFAKLHFGDVAYVPLPELDLDVRERVVEYVWFPTIQKFKSIVLGNDLKRYTSRVETGTQALQQKIESRTESMVSNVLNATAWITGNSGGNVVFRPEKAPEEILIMDTKDVNTAKKLWRWNLRGLGYSSTGVNGPFPVAMTSNGEIVADFIKAGILSGILIQGVAIKTMDDQDFQVVMEGGKVSFEKKKKSTGLHDVHSDLEYGSIFATYGTGGETNGFAIGQRPGQIFSINSFSKDTSGSSNPVIQLPRECSSDNRLINIYAKGEWEGDLNIKGNLTINGEKVFPGQGGGGGGGGDWDGAYPPEVKTQADKFAWELWVYLLSKGYSKAAAAGILGNVQGEVGAGMNPDTGQVGGPAYGIVQWDGSAYPLVPPATYDGRAYVQNLMRAAGITDDYKTIKAQSQLLEWSMYNGQWMFKVQPATVAGYKTLTDPSNAAYVFLNNFERPATQHPERNGWAVDWYNKFKDAQITSGGELLTVAKSMLGWFYYVQVHPSADLGSDLLNPNRNGGTDCSGYVWLVLYKAGYRVPANMGWYTGSMTSDARGAQRYLKEVPMAQGKAGDIFIANAGAGVGNDGHTSILVEDWHGYETKVIEQGGGKNSVGYGKISTSYGYLLQHDLCIARPIK